MKTITKSILAAASAVFLTLSAQAVSITLGGPHPSFRTATLGDALSGSTGSGNATAAVVSTALGGTWTERGDVAGGSGAPGIYSNGMLSINLLSGSWGDKGPLNGTWTITNPNFWSAYAQGAISLHVGGGQASPDHFIWKLEPTDLTGTWSYNGSGLSGGGLSNLKLFSQGAGSDIPGRVPDGGSTIALLGLAVAALAFAKRKF